MTLSNANFQFTASLILQPMHESLCDIIQIFVQFSLVVKPSSKNRHIKDELLYLCTYKYILSTTSSNLRREQGGSPVQINWQAGVGGAAQRHRESVQTTPQHLHCSCPGPVPHLSSRCHLSPGKRGCSTERGGGEDGEAIEGR